MSKTVVAFDLYGTLLSTESIQKELASHFGDEKATTIATTWRKYQLEYTWRLNSMNVYEPFNNVTRKSLLHALKESSVTLSDADIGSLMKAYDSLRTFPDVNDALESLKSLAQSASVVPVVFSNGTQSMVSNSVHHSPSLSPYSSLFQDIVVVEKVKKYKPAPEVYKHLAESVGVSEMSQMWLVSGNPFDVIGARAIGMKAAWVDRQGNGWQDQLGLDLGDGGSPLEPTVVVKDLSGVVAAVKEYL